MNGNNAYAIETSGLNYIFSQGRKVVNEVSLQVPEQSIFGFLGPNGAGKTTTIRLLTGMLANETDNIFIRGSSLKKNIPGIFKTMGTLIETPSLYLHLSGRDNLKVITRLRNIKENKVDEVLKMVGLYHDAKRKVKEYSLGMKQRLGIALALLPEPGLLILDEPANGLDPAGIIEVREMLIRLNREQGKTIFVSSHLLNEVEKTCTHVGIIHKGALKFQGTMAELQTNAGHGKLVTIRIADALKWKGLVTEKFPQATLTQYNDFVFPLQDTDEVNRINQQLVQDGVPVNGIRLNEGLEEWFIKMTSN
ncbi:MAG TPA: ATP-binding cassette domain-containing protein [Chitinophagaceae bacterium]|nr:ATP-binding cassette domain-containing protein [Chitinophagaceae bacterium]